MQLIGYGGADDGFNHAALVGCVCAVVGLVGCVVAPVTAEIPRWMMVDPFKVCARIEAMEQAQVARTPESKQERAARKLKELSKDPPTDDLDNRR